MKGPPDPRELVSLISALDDRRVREAHGLFKIERFGSFVKAMDAGIDLVGLVLCPRLVRNELVQMLVRRARARGVPALTVSPEVFRAHAVGARASGVVGVFRARWGALPAPVPDGVWVAVESLRSPGNLGCILRTCEAAGVRGVIVGQALDPWDPRVIGSSMGAEAGLPLIRATPEAVRRWAGAHDVLEVGTSPRAEKAWDQVPYPPRTVLWLGGEREGMHAGSLAGCGVAVRIPILGRADSLNVATAAGILVYELVRQQRARQGDGAAAPT